MITTVATPVNALVGPGSSSRVMCGLGNRTARGDEELWINSVDGRAKIGL
jgi:hypothetical protein